jgi:hypothetical protein
MFETTCILMFLCSVFPQTSIVTQHITIALWNINYSLFIYLSYYCCLRRHIKVIIDVYADILKHLLKVLFQDLSISLCTHLLLINIFTCHMHLWLKFFCLFCIHEDEYHYLVHCNQFSRRILLTTLRHIPCNMRYMTWNNVMKFKHIANQCSVQSFQSQKIVLSHQKFNRLSVIQAL